MDSYYKLRQLFLLQNATQFITLIATGITKCDEYHKLQQYHCNL